MEMGISELPEEMLIEILSRLPAKSVGMCRCIAKPWRALLSTPDFLKSHITLKPHQENLILITGDKSIATTIDVAAASKILDLPIYNCFDVAGSCDGLVLLENTKDAKFLVNPITLEQVKIPDSLAQLKDFSFRMHGFGYDRLSNDYKVVTVTHYDKDNENESDCAGTFVDVYSVKWGIWIRVCRSPYVHDNPTDVFPGAFVNGAIHWLATKRESGHPSVIAAFNLADEVFDEIPAPRDLDVKTFVYNRLTVLEGCLCMTDNQSNIRSDIWIMKEYGVGDSWTKITVDTDYDTDEHIILKPLCFIGDEEIVLLEIELLTEEATLVVYNLKERSLSEMPVDGVSTMYMNGGAFVESLVSPAGGRV